MRVSKRYIKRTRERIVQVCELPGARARQSKVKIKERERSSKSDRGKRRQVCELPGARAK